jgi:hypothetical protein
LNVDPPLRPVAPAKPQSRHPCNDDGQRTRCPLPGISLTVTLPGCPTRSRAAEFQYFAF